MAKGEASNAGSRQAGQLPDLMASLTAMHKLPWLLLASCPVHPDRLPKFRFEFNTSWCLPKANFSSSSHQVDTMQEVNQYSEREGRSFFNSLDSDSKGYLTHDDLKNAMRAKNLPESYASKLARRAKGPHWWLSTITWEQFKSLLDQIEPQLLAAFNSLAPGTERHMQVEEVKDLLRRGGLSDRTEAAAAMIRAVGGDEGQGVPYSNLRNFMVLLPPEKLQGPLGPGLAWYEAATCDPPPSPVAPRSQSAGGLQAVLFGALAGGLGASTSTLLLHPIDTLKTRLQTIPGARMTNFSQWWGTIGVRGLYRGIVPAASGAMVGHGLRTGGYEAALKLIQGACAGGFELQAQGMASGVGTVVGTVARIPCEVLKQRLQAGLYPDSQTALRASLSADGFLGLFRGTLATLSRDVPFYMLGVMLFQQLKALAAGPAWDQEHRKLSRSHVVALGVTASCTSALLTTPADVLKTRIMTMGAGQQVSTIALVAEIVSREGVRALFKGAVARMLWTVPVGAINFAGYDLAKQALVETPRSHQGGHPAGSGGERAEQKYVPHVELAKQALVENPRTHPWSHRVEHPAGLGGERAERTSTPCVETFRAKGPPSIQEVVSPLRLAPENDLIAVALRDRDLVGKQISGSIL